MSSEFGVGALGRRSYAGGPRPAPISYMFEPKPAKSGKCAKCVKSDQLFFFGPSGGKSDAAASFLIVPRSISEISGRHVSRCLGGNREAKSIRLNTTQLRAIQLLFHSTQLDIQLRSSQFNSCRFDLTALDSTYLQATQLDSIRRGLWPLGV